MQGMYAVDAFKNFVDQLCIDFNFKTVQEVTVKFIFVGFLAQVLPYPLV